MRTPRFILPDLTDQFPAEAQLDESESRHLLASLRLSPGDAIQLYHPESRRTFCGEFVAAQNERAIVRITSELKLSPLFPITLQIAGVSPAASDTIVEKAVELGIQEVHFFSSERSQERLKGDRAAKRLERFERIALAALKQSGAAAIPRISAFASLQEALQSANEHPGAKKVLCAAPSQDGQTLDIPHLLTLIGGEHGAPRSPLERIPQYADFIVMIGPEGGFSSAELVQIHGSGFSPFSLGPNTLRAETAAIAALSLLSAMIVTRGFPGAYEMSPL